MLSFDGLGMVEVEEENQVESICVLLGHVDLEYAEVFYIIACVG